MVYTNGSVATRWAQGVAFVCPSIGSVLSRTDQLIAPPSFAGTSAPTGGGAPPNDRQRSGKCCRATEVHGAQGGGGGDRVGDAGQRFLRWRPNFGSDDYK